MNVVAQLFGVGAMIALFSLYQQKSRNRMIAAKMVADICWVAHYGLLGGIAGMIPNFVGIFRELVFVNRGKRRWANTVMWPVVFVAANAILGLRTFHSWFNVLPIAASAFVTVSLWINNPKLTKLISVPVSLAFLIYDIYVGSYVGIVNESIAVGSIGLSFLREHIQKEKEL